MESPHSDNVQTAMRVVFALLLLGLCFVIKVRVTVSLLTFTAALMLSVAFINVQQSFAIPAKTKEVATSNETENGTDVIKSGGTSTSSLEAGHGREVSGTVTVAAPRVPLIRHDGVRPFPARDSRHADWNL